MSNRLLQSLAGLPPGRIAALYALAALAIAWAWLACVVHFNYDGHWSGLFYTGESFRQPPAGLEHEDIRKHPGHGYDGQMYHYVAHDPFMQRGFQSSCDSPRFRYQRILVPLLAWVIALGRDEWVDRAYFAVILGFVFLGVYWMSRLALMYRQHPRLGLLFLICPASLISLDRMTIDIAAAALALGALHYFTSGSRLALWIAIAASSLSRESGILAPAALILYSFWRERRLAQCALMASAFLPSAFWALHVWARTAPDPPTPISPIPFHYLIARILHPFDYTLPPVVEAAAQLGDLLCLSALLLCVYYAASRLRDLGQTALGWAACAWVAFLAALSIPAVWEECYAYGRIFTPLLLLIAVDGMRRRDRVAFLPLLLFLPRIGLQLAPQLSRILLGLFDPA